MDETDFQCQQVSTLFTDISSLESHNKQLFTFIFQYILSQSPGWYDWILYHLKSNMELWRDDDQSIEAAVYVIDIMLSITVQYQQVEEMEKVRKQLLSI